MQVFETLPCRVTSDADWTAKRQGDTFVWVPTQTDTAEWTQGEGAGNSASALNLSAACKDDTANNSKTDRDP